MPGFMFSRANLSDLDKGAYWQEAFWLVENSESIFDRESSDKAELLRYGKDGKGEQMVNLPPSLKEI